MLLHCRTQEHNPGPVPLSNHPHNLLRNVSHPTTHRVQRVSRQAARAVVQQLRAAQGSASTGGEASNVQATGPARQVRPWSCAELCRPAGSATGRTGNHSWCLTHQVTCWRAGVAVNGGRAAQALGSSGPAEPPVHPIGSSSSSSSSNLHRIPLAPRQQDLPSSKIHLALQLRALARAGGREQKGQVLVSSYPPSWGPCG